MPKYEDELRSSFTNSLNAQYAIAVIGERVLLAEAARQMLIKDPAAAERDFSSFILTIARAPEAEWLHDHFLLLPGIDEHGNLHHAKPSSRIRGELKTVKPHSQPVFRRKKD